MVTRTTTTRTIPGSSEPSAKAIDNDPFPITFDEVVQSYLHCCKTKRRTKEHLLFQINLTENLQSLYEDLKTGSYGIGQSTCFIVTKPKVREIWAASFRDRIVHHVLIGRMFPRALPQFSVGSCACIPERGTLYGVNRISKAIRRESDHWKKPLYYLKMDVSNFFASISKEILYEICLPYTRTEWERNLLHQVIFHDPTSNFIFKGNLALRALIPRGKSLLETDPLTGLPIGNFSSQFFANAYLNVMDQFIDHVLKPLGFVRYVDDFLLLGDTIEELLEWEQHLHSHLKENLNLAFNPRKTIIQPVIQGVDFVGYVILPWRTRPRRSLLSNARERLRENCTNETLQSYLGLLSPANAYRDASRLIEFYEGISHEYS